MRKNTLLQSLLLSWGGVLGLLWASSQPAWAAPPEKATTVPASGKVASSQRALPPLTEKMFYDILLADVAMQRDDPILAAQTFLRLAQQTRSPWFAQRAADSALAARNASLLESALNLWQKYEPTAERPKKLREQVARLNLLSLSDETGGGQRLRDQLALRLREADSKGYIGATLLQLNTVLAKLTDKIAAFDIVRDVALPYNKQPEAHYAVALAAFVAANNQEAKESPQIKEVVAEGIREVNQALAVEPDWPEALQLKVLLMDAGGVKELLPWLENEVKRRPDEKSLWAFLARLYVKNQQLPKAREWFLKIWRDNQSNDALVAAAAVTMQMKDPQLANLLVDEVRANGDDRQLLGLLLTYARIAENEGRVDDAINWYKRIEQGDGWWGAQLQIAELLARNGRDKEAHAWLLELPAVTREERISVAKMQASIYRDKMAWGDARKVLEKAVQAFPDEPDLLLDLALTVEKQGDVTRAVALLRQALAHDPDSPYLQNALGYTLVDHRLGVEEGAKLIEQALAAMPEEGSILDSMGWALFRQQKSEESLDYLRRALAVQPDAEIAAHLGEVLWSLGRFDEARNTWKDGIERFAPRDAIIRNTMRRLKVEQNEPQPGSVTPMVPHKLLFR